MGINSWKIKLKLRDNLNICLADECITEVVVSNMFCAEQTNTCKVRCAIELILLNIIIYIVNPRKETILTWRECQLSLEIEYINLWDGKYPLLRSEERRVGKECL